MRKLFEYLVNLTKAETAESSKRFLAIFVGVFLVSYIVIGYTRVANSATILSLICGFVLALQGVASWQDVKKNGPKDRPKNES